MQQKFEIAQKLPSGEPSLVGSGGLVDLDAATTAFGKLSRAFAKLSDRRAAWVVGAMLFTLAAWPLALTEVPPYQDLPNHLAALTVIHHPERYPEFVANGFLKTNAALFSWLYFVGGVVGTTLAAKLFALLVIGAGAFTLPHFVLRFTNRNRMVVASLLGWPMAHNWFVSMGMLDFALAVPLSLLLLMAVDRFRKAPSGASGALVFGLALATWYAHVFALLVASLLALVHVVTDGAPTEARWSARAWRKRAREALLVFGPQAPVLLLTLWSIHVQLSEPDGAMHGFVSFHRLLPPWELFYNMFAEWMFGFTNLSITSLVPTLLIPALAFSRRWDRTTFFGPVALLVLWAFYLVTPYSATNWFHVNTRFVGFLWIAMLLRVPDRLDRRVGAALAVCAVLYSAGMGVDYVRLDRDRAKVTAGIPVVPEGARLLPLIFNQKATSENTRSLLHTWGFYVAEKKTSAPLLFAHSRSFPVMYRQPPPIQFNHLVLEAFAPTMISPEWECSMLRSAGIAENDCVATWRDRWAEFWRQSTPEFDHVLMWDAPPDVLALVPPHYRPKFSQDRLTIFERVNAP